MTVRSVVCVILIRSFVAVAFPTSDNDGEPVVIELPVSGVAEFSGTAPVTGSVAIIGHAPCPEFLLPSPSTPILTQAIENDEASKITEFDEPSPPKTQDNDEMNSNDPIPKKVILAAILADSFMAEKGAEIDAKLAEFDAFVEKELAIVGPIIQTALVNADTSEIDSSLDSSLLELESQISAELTMLDEFIESELAETEELVESVIRNVETITGNNAENVSAEKDPPTELELAMLESFVESTLEKSEVLVESELEKVNSLIESELAKVDSIVESELHKVDLFIEKELAKTDAVVKSEMSKMESILENELATVYNSMEDIADSVTASSDHGNHKDEINEDQVRTIAIDGTFHVTGRTLIIGSTGCPSPFNTGEPLPLYVESFPIFETEDDETYEPQTQSEDVINDDSCIIKLPIMGEAVFSGVAPAVGTCKILGACSCDSLLPSINSNISPPTVGDANPIIPLMQAAACNKQYFTISENNEPSAEPDSVLYHKKQLPMVVLRNLKAGQKPIGAVILKGDVEFSGNAEGLGRTRLSADFPCPELTASEEGPDGKKYIWIAKKPCNKDAPSKQKQSPSPKPDCPSFTEDFPETIIMDANKNYEKHIGEGLVVDFGLLGPLPVDPQGTF